MCVEIHNDTYFTSKQTELQIFVYPTDMRRLCHLLRITNSNLVRPWTGAMCWGNKVWTTPRDSLTRRWHKNGIKILTLFVDEIKYQKPLNVWKEEKARVCACLQTPLNVCIVNKRWNICSSIGRDVGSSHSINLMWHIITFFFSVLRVGCRSLLFLWQILLFWL